MRTAFTCTCILILLFATASQAQSTDPFEEGGPYTLSANSETTPCISQVQYDYIKTQCDLNIARLGLTPSASRSSVSLSWPLRQANGLQDCSYYRISAYVDEDTTAGIKDWNCGSNTYNGHRGTDIATYPYPFYKMDNNQVEVIAAAPGTIIFKSDTSFDKNCNGSSQQANYVVIQHSDGTLAYYFHMKKHSVTTKTVGQTVALGEYLGVVGSSGDASGPHLHFEVRTSTSNNDYKDPWAGTCNYRNANSWWISQTPYTEPAIVKAQVGLVDPVFPACPITETPNEDSCIPSGASAKFNVIFRNETSGLTANMRIIKPDGTNLSTWTHNSNASYTGSYYSYTRTLPAVPGVYVFEAVYNNITCAKTFQVACGSLTAVESAGNLNTLQAYPNPTYDQLHISCTEIENGNYQVTINNLLGQQVFNEKIKTDNGALQHNISVAQLPAAMYVLTIQSASNKQIIKFEKTE